MIPAKSDHLNQPTLNIWPENLLEKIITLNMQKIRQIRINLGKIPDQLIIGQIPQDFKKGFIQIADRDIEITVIERIQPDMIQAERTIREFLHNPGLEFHSDE